MRPDNSAAHRGLSGEWRNCTPHSGNRIHSGSNRCLGIERSRERKKIAFRSVIPDSESAWIARSAPPSNQSANSRYDPGANGFQTVPNLFRTRWVVGVPAEPLRVSRGSRIKLRLTQTQEIDDKPALVRRAHLSVSSRRILANTRQRCRLDREPCETHTTDPPIGKDSTVPLPVMAEQPDYDQRTTLEFERGNSLPRSGLRSFRTCPEFFHACQRGRLGIGLTLAKWFFAPGQPLTARTAVNRYWEQLFGTGIVETLENFGSCG